MTVADITTMSRRIGRLRIESAQVRGEGGLVNPPLVLPLSGELEPQLAQQRLAVTEVRAELSLTTGPSGARLGDCARVRGVGGNSGVWSSNPSSTISHAADLRFVLTAPQVHLLDIAAAQGERVISLLVRFELEAAWLRDEPQDVLSHSSGSALELLPLAWIRAAEMTIAVPRSEWAEGILPALGAPYRDSPAATGRADRRGPAGLV